MRNEPQHEKIENIGPFGFMLGFASSPQPTWATTEIGNVLSPDIPLRGGLFLYRQSYGPDRLPGSQLPLNEKRVGWGEERTPTWVSETSVRPGLCWGSQAHPNLPGLETTLTNQPRGIRLEFRAVAVNKAGEGEPSNGVLAVL